MSRLKILRLFVVIAFVAIITLPLYSIFVINPLYNGFIVRETEKVVENIAHQISFHLIEVSNLSKDNLPADFIREIENTKKLIGLWKIKVYSPDGVIVYSTYHTEIGGNTSKTFFPDIIRTGETHTLLSRKEGLNRYGERHKFDLVETYVPIIRSGRVIGVFEIYYDITKSKKELGSLAAHSNMATYLISMILGVLIILLALKAGRSLVLEKKAERKLKIFSARLANLEESAKQKIAIELHDRVGQKLSALNLNLNIIKNRFTHDDSGEAETFFADSFRLIEESTEEIRDIMSELRPSNLDDHGLAAAIRCYSGKITMRTGLKIDIIDDEPGLRLTENVETPLFRIAQEALTNVVKHAKAHSVTVRIEHRQDCTRMTIHDDGIGFTRETSGDEASGLGIIAMRERITAIGGRMELNSAPGEGTSISVEV